MTFARHHRGATPDLFVMIEVDDHFHRRGPVPGRRVGQHVVGVVDVHALVLIVVLPAWTLVAAVLRPEVRLREAQIRRRAAEQLSGRGEQPRVQGQIVEAVQAARENDVAAEVRVALRVLAARNREALERGFAHLADQRFGQQRADQGEPLFLPGGDLRRAQGSLIVGQRRR